MPMVGCQKRVITEYSPECLGYGKGGYVFDNPTTGESVKGRQAQLESGCWTSSLSLMLRTMTP